jgi:glucose-1-phosphate cytidylyltransferase
MKTMILAGGLGTRLAEETEVIPKPMVEIGGRPILWHIMKHYAFHGFNEFAVALGYRGDVIKKFFLDEQSMSGSMTIDLARGLVTPHERRCEPWTVHLAETGASTLTGGRVRRLRSWVGKETFMATYGDGVADVDLGALVRFHKSHGLLATLTAVRPPARFGALVFEEGGDRITRFSEKPQTGEGWINGGFFVFEPGVFDFLKGDDASLEGHALERIAEQGQLAAYRHDGFWQCMDTLRDKKHLASLWDSGRAPWKVWE